MTTYPEVPIAERGPTFKCVEVKVEDPLIRMQRRIAWQRARGELMALLETYQKIDEEFEKVDEVVREFCEWMEEEL